MKWPRDLLEVQEIAHTIDENLMRARQNTTRHTGKFVPAPRNPAPRNTRNINAIEALSETNISAVQDRRGPFKKLDNATRQRLLKEGKCFYCKSTGHRANECPNKKKPGQIATVEIEESIIVTQELKEEGL